ncbi:MAG: hypothetical protein IKX89_07385 [Firmicutes bacterium]|nr:hypothetical protein [Bacillota bacterium]
MENIINSETELPKNESKNIVLCRDGAYRWVYELNLFRDFSILGLVLKLFGGIILAGAVIFFIVELFGSHDYMGVLQMAGIMIGIFLVLSVLGYLLYAAIMGGSYCVVFTMDDKGILHEQQARQAKKADLISDLLVIAGALSGNVTTIGVGLSSAKRTTMHTTFKGTKKLSGFAKRGLIKLDSPMDHNRVYCEEEDFNFVWNYIKSRCEGAEIKERF